MNKFTVKTLTFCPFVWLIFDQVIRNLKGLSDVSQINLLGVKVVSTNFKTSTSVIFYFKLCFMDAES